MQMKTMCNLYNHSPFPFRKMPLSMIPHACYRAERSSNLVITLSHLMGRLLRLSEVGPSITAQCSQWLLWDTIAKRRISPVWEFTSISLQAAYMPSETGTSVQHCERLERKSSLFRTFVEQIACDVKALGVEEFVDGMLEKVDRSS